MYTKSVFIRIAIKWVEIKVLHKATAAFKMVSRNVSVQNGGN